MADFAERVNVEREFLLCARYGELEEMLEELEKGADVMCRGEGGQTALHMACANGHEAVVAALLERGAEINATNDCGNTPAHYAAQQRHAKCLRLIVEREGADVLARNEFGRSALTDAIASGDGAVATIALEHESATEEKIIAGLEATGLAEVTHDFSFGGGDDDDGPALRVRELQISKSVDETLGDGGGATDRTGLGIWAASLALARWLAERADAFDGAKVVELGAGCGVGGLALAAASATARVCLTDCHAETLANCDHNVKLFLEDRPADAGAGDEWFGSAARVACAKLDWDDTTQEATCDFVVGADLVYHEAVVDKLVKTVVRLNAKEFWYVAPATGRAGGDAFLARLETLGFEHVAKDAPPAYTKSALKGGDDDKFVLYFPDVVAATFKLHRFVRPFK